jgi:hypothetical protein
LCVLKADSLKCLKIGIQLVDDVFPGFSYGDFATIYGDEASMLGFMLCVRGVSPSEYGGLDSEVVFIDGGNSFNPYLVAEIARGWSLNPREVMERIFVSRAFTAYQLSALILEKLDKFLEGRDADLIFVSDIASLFMDRDIPKTEAQNLFLKVCQKLAEVAMNRRKIVLATYRSDRSSRRGLFFEAVLFGQINVLIKFDRKDNALRFVLLNHPRVKPFELEVPTGNMLLTSFMEA